jgi:alkylated DNA nucleotide flippase Atl1
MGVGIFVGIAARAAEEAKDEGGENITPYWRTLKSGGELNEKYPGGTEAQAEKLKAEGHTIEAKGKKVRVRDFEKKLVEL